MTTEEKEGREVVGIEDPDVKAAIDKLFGDLHQAEPDFKLSTEQKAGVLMSMLVSQQTELYRQTLRTAAFMDGKQSGLAADALSEVERYGAPLTPIVNRIEAQNGERGPHGVRGMILEAMTHYNLSTTSGYNKNKPRDKSKPL